MHPQYLGGEYSRQVATTLFDRFIESNFTSTHGLECEFGFGSADDVANMNAGAGVESSASLYISNEKVANEFAGWLRRASAKGKHFHFAEIGLGHPELLAHVEEIGLLVVTVHTGTAKAGK
jgi:hypothetical protein